jgi:hypothetical protein
MSIEEFIHMIYTMPYVCSAQTKAPATRKAARVRARKRAGIFTGLAGQLKERDNYEKGSNKFWGCNFFKPCSDADSRRSGFCRCFQFLSQSNRHIRSREQQQASESDGDRDVPKRQSAHYWHAHRTARYKGRIGQGGIQRALQ